MVGSPCTLSARGTAFPLRTPAALAHSNFTQIAACPIQARFRPRDPAKITRLSADSVPDPLGDAANGKRSVYGFRNLLPG